MDGAIRKFVPIFIAAALCVFVSLRAVDQIKRNNQVESHSRELDLFYSLFTNQLYHNIDVAQKIAKDKILIDAVSGNLREDDPHVLAVLGAVQRTSDASLCYVIRADGDVVASTTYSGGKRLTGNNYAFRPYFKRAMDGHMCVYPALGVTTNKRGLYISSPIFSQEHGNVVGAVVFKMTMDKVEALLDGYSHLCFLVSSENVVFASNNASFLYSSVGPLSDETLSKIEKSRQFAGVQIKELPFAEKGNVAVIGGREYGVLSRGLESAGWNMRSYYDIKVSGGITILQLSFVVLSASVLFIFITLTFSLIINMRMDWDLLYRKLRVKIFVPTAISLLVLIGGTTLVVLWYSQEQFVKSAIQMTEKLEKIVVNEVAESSELMIGLIEILKKNEEVVEAWKMKDRKRLYAATKDYLSGVSSRYKVSQLYFHQVDMVNFLRVHNPDDFGKLSKRTLVSKNSVVKGLQVGPHGSCSLRVIAPWTIDGEFVGYVEMASDFTHHLPHIQNNVAGKLAFTVRKKLLDRELWLEGDGEAHQPEEWDLADELVVLYPKGDSELAKVVNVAEHSKAGVRYFDIRVEDKRLVGGGIDINDVTGNSVGTLFIYSDVSDMEMNSWLVAMSLVVGVISACWIIFSFYWFFLGSIERRVVVAHESLESEIAERIKVEEKLVVAKEEAVRATHAKSEFLAKMTHEIRTPMNGVLGMLEILHKTKLTKTQKHYAEVAQKSAKGLISIINDILDFSKIEAGKLTLTDEAFNLRELFVDTGGMLSFIASEKNLDLILNVQKKLPSAVVSDPLRLKQILINLIGNAIKFTDAGHVKVCLSCRIIAENEVEVQVSVEDTGAGISVAAQKDLFDEFTQVDSASTRKAGGTGLGLAISRQLVELMGGEISLSSTVGVGTIFSFTIPMLLPASVRFENLYGSGMCDDDFEIMALKSDNMQVLEGDDEYVEPEISNVKLPVSVLLVEDNVVNQKVATILFEDIGCEVTVVSNGAKAVKEVFEADYDIVFMDGNMPVMDGFEATKTIREHEQKRKLAYDANCSGDHRIPIVALSALACDGVERFREAGADGFVPKPLSQKSIADAIIKYCDLQKIPGVVLPVSASEETFGASRDFAEKPVFNRDYLVSVAGDNIEVRKSIVDSFISDGAACIDTLVDELRGERDTTVISRAAHAFKGMLGYVGAERLVEFAASIEESAIADTLSPDADYIEKLVINFEDLKSELEAFCLE